MWLSLVLLTLPSPTAPWQGLHSRVKWESLSCSPLAWTFRLVDSYWVYTQDPVVLVSTFCSLGPFFCCICTYGKAISLSSKRDVCCVLLVVKSLHSVVAYGVIQGSNFSRDFDHYLKNIVNDFSMREASYHMMNINGSLTLRMYWLLWAFNNMLLHWKKIGPNYFFEEQILPDLILSF